MKIFDLTNQTHEYVLIQTVLLRLWLFGIILLKGEAPPHS